jgi:hypothetical protein
MKKKNLLIVLGAISIFIITTASTLSSGGKSGKADSPGEGNCSSCHNNSPVNGGGGAIVITSSNLPSSPSWNYVPGQTYHMTVTVAEASRLCFGLCFEALNSANANAGTLVITNSTEMKLLTAGNGRTCVTHQSGGGNVSVAGFKQFNFDWTAPASDVGTLTFYVAGIAGIANSDDADDNTYTSKIAVYSPTTIGIDEITSNTSFSIFPNPVNDVINISLSNNSNGNVKASLYSIAGEKVADLFDETVLNGAIVKSIAVSQSWAKGIYFIRIEQQERTTTKRILIQ